MKLQLSVNRISAATFGTETKQASEEGGYLAVEEVRWRMLPCDATAEYGVEQQRQRHAWSALNLARVGT